MKLKTSAIFLLGVLLLILFVRCQPSDKSDSKAFNAEETLAKLDGFLLRLNQIDNRDCKNLDEIVTINESMRRIVENIRTKEMFEGLMNAFDEKKHQIGFTFSEDEQFAVFSWQTKMDCLGHSIKNIALFKHNETIKTSSLYGNPMMYEHIKSHKQNKNATLYILQGIAYSDDLTQKGYTISNGYLVESQIPETEQAYANNSK